MWPLIPSGEYTGHWLRLESPQSSCLIYWTYVYSDIVFRSFLFLFKTILIWQFEWYTKCLMLSWFDTSLSPPKLYIARLRLYKVNYYKTLLKHCSIYNLLYVWISCCYNNNGMVYSNIKIYRSNTFVLSVLWITNLFFLWSSVGTTVLAFWLWGSSLILTMASWGCDFLIILSWGDNPRAWHHWKVPEDHITNWSKHCEWNWVDKTVWKPPMVILIRSQVHNKEMGRLIIEAKDLLSRNGDSLKIPLPSTLVTCRDLLAWKIQWLKFFLKKMSCL